MKRLTYCVLAAFFLVPVGASADDLTARLGNGQGWATLTVADGRVAYTIITNGIGNVTGASIQRNGNTFLDLNASGGAGSAFGSVNGGNADLDDLQANPGRYTVRVNGGNGNISGTLSSAGPSFDGGTSEPVDLRNIKTVAKRNGKVIVVVKNLGDVDSAATSASVFLSDDAELSDDDQFGSIVVRSLAPNQRRRFRQRLNYPADVSGPNFVCTLLDPANLNGDPNPDNNVTCRRVNVP